MKKLLNIPDRIRTVGLLPLGYPAEEQRNGPSRKPVEEFCFSEQWNDR